eukprot:CAMPEP_0202691978 /NCGR_PEP_ID=MMETSP1385-20130828/6506_1 /ASSEMBLY_ACC=CAM_ASM_000861 /TAXON_ID=933848 /ORGANISM="Elphidium margaritaceum" /LENGTH=135 /DNA_ID=CAMNT_0049347443 /DNA_START=19 /DNA_END=423 /DNA_ORIENTATION=+
MAYDEEDCSVAIEAALVDEKEWDSIQSFLKSKYMTEQATFHNYHVRYKNESDAGKRKELGDRMIVKFLTLDGDATLPDHVSLYRDLKRRMKKLKDADYPTDLFNSAHDKLILSIATVWDEYIASKQKQQTPQTGK